MNKTQKLFTIVLLILLAIFACQKINLITADLGRHLKNGELVFKDTKVLFTNYYSYTQQDFPVVNHHWLSGLIFYHIYDLTGFFGLHLFFLGLLLLSVYIIIISSENKYAGLIGLIITLPLLTYRKEIRPEIFSLFFFSVYLLIIKLLKQDRISDKKFLLIITITQIIWVNLHIFYIFGIILVFFSLIDELINNKKKTKTLFLSLILISFGCLINPNFLKGALQPFTIFHNYNYKVAENQTLLFAIKRLQSPIYGYSLILSLFTAFIYLKQLKQIKLRCLFYDLIMIFFLLLSLKYIRTLNFLGLALILFFSLRFKTINKGEFYGYLTILTTLIFVSLPFSSIFNPVSNPYFGLGADTKALESANFFRQNNLKGPVFNNYDIGGYLIFTLSDKEKVFIDNRPEAYPSEFFEHNYIKPQQQEQNWKNLDKKYNFNIIYFYRLDQTEWAQPFLIRRIQDPNWQAVYVDEFTLILIKNNKDNQKIIQQYKLPNEIFKISSE
ncbi:MAG: hypothetical protein KatS3mg091_035 [Patescibacteria group bacterium]|nr:MAG: hypothetical protein KatS3mg091_035 [Patescibacteria group bacterium]